MKQETLRGPAGHDIPCWHQAKGTERQAVLILHGLGSSKESSTALRLAAALAEADVACLCFDLPAHGANQAGPLRIDTCLDDIAAAEARLGALAPQAGLGYFGSSFGAYLTLLYLETRPHRGSRAFLRCAAVDMPGLFRRDVMPEQEAAMRTQGYIMLDAGYARPLKITPGFLDDLAAYDAFALWRPGLAELAMIHGDADTVAPLADAARFAALAGAPLYVVPGAGHSFDSPGGMEQVLERAAAFFTA